MHEKWSPCRIHGFYDVFFLELEIEHVEILIDPGRSRNPIPRASMASRSRPSLAKAYQVLHWRECFFRRSMFRAISVRIAHTRIGPRCT